MRRELAIFALTMFGLAAVAFGAEFAAPPVVTLTVIERSGVAKRAFAKTHPCPSTGERVPHCPGYVIDHRWPLCAGGRDEPENMQWLSIEEAKVKDLLEKKLCAKEKPCTPRE